MNTFNLQFFAAMTSGTSSLSPEMKTYYEKRLIDAAEPMLIHDQFGEKYNIPKGSGKTIEFRKFSSLPIPTTALTEGVTPNGNSLTVSKVEGTISQWGDYVTLADILTYTAIDPMIENAQKVLGAQAGKKSDHLTRDVLATCTNVMYAPKSDGTPVTTPSGLDATCLLTKQLILKAVAQLRTNNAEPFEDGCYIGIVHPMVACDLMNSEGWTDAHRYTDAKSLWLGEIGSLGGVRFVENSEAFCEGVPSSGSVSAFHTLIIGKGAYAVTELEGMGLQHIFKPLGSGDDPLNQRATSGWKLAKCAEILDPTRMMRIVNASATAPTLAAN